MDSKRVKYTVNEEHGIVKAEISCCTFDAFTEFNKKFMWHSTSAMEMCGDIANSNQQFMMPYKFSAVAKLHPGDTWDEEKGKKIALRKLSRSYHNAIDKRLTYMFIALDKSMEKMMDYLIKHDMIEIEDCEKSA